AGFLPNRESLSQRIAKTPPDQLAALLFEYVRIPQPLIEAVQKLPSQELMARCIDRLKQLIAEKKDVTDAVVSLLKRFGRPAEPLARAWVDHLKTQGLVPYPAAIGALAAA